MYIDPSIVGYSFDLTEGQHILEDSGGWSVYVQLDSTLQVENLFAHNSEIGYFVYSEYGDSVRGSDNEAIREFRRQFYSYIQ